MSNLGGLDGEMEQNVTEENKVSKITDIAEVKPKRRPFHYWEVGDRTFKLKLTTAMIGKLENKYRTNILNLVSENGLPPLSVMLTIVQAAMTPWEHGISYTDVMCLYDSWAEKGGNQMEFLTSILMPTMAVSGFFTEKQAASMMESLKEADELL